MRIVPRAIGCRHLLYSINIWISVWPFRSNYPKRSSSLSVVRDINWSPGSPMDAIATNGEQWMLSHQVAFI
ncbi:hypothetical protein TNCV_5075591 [Trichonephila clavipes]|uniref:Uncharacterized protein n=1 Tax=Trichonephila clavipes TaxID=2585209 RepID=A0A8X6S185_TRICX|nr:hypothetical protein TNCV_5075591 [Trichonephila clavipes]